jgi:hypothetical protein
VRSIAEHDHRVAQAWLTANLGNARRLPPLARLLHRRRRRHHDLPNPEQYREHLERISEQIAAARRERDEHQRHR